MTCQTYCRIIEAAARRATDFEASESRAVKARRVAARAACALDRALRVHLDTYHPLTVK